LTAEACYRELRLGQRDEASVQDYEENDEVPLHERGGGGEREREGGRKRGREGERQTDRQRQRGGTEGESQRARCHCKTTRDMSVLGHISSTTHQPE